ncbi:Protein suppressor of hairy wing [Gryllus bimaculatus]|nr:Protein suppressor of hairy wing [Gryllus bimaculatus]
MESAQYSRESGSKINTTHSSTTICNESIRNEILSVRSESPDSQKMYKCSICESTFFRRSHLRDHLNHHTKDRQYQCKEINCCKAYFSWKHLRRHLISQHKLINVKKSLYMKTESKKHKCLHEGCNATFDRHWKLTSHMWKHTGEKHHSCTENGCSKVYTSVGRLRRHIAISHKPSSGTVMYLECEECNSKFISVIALKNHMKKTHSFQMCSEPDCRKVFSNFSLLKEHKKADHSKVFACPTCNKKLRSETLLKKHQQTHVLPEERKLFTCPYKECGRFYTRRFNLDQHIRSSHEGIKFHCAVPGCEKSLVTKQKLQEHMKLHDPLREPQQRKQMARRQRKDAGKPKRSMAAKLSGIQLSFREEQNVLHSSNNLSVTGQCTSKSNDSSKSSDAESEMSVLSDEHREESDECEESCVMIANEPDISVILQWVAGSFQLHKPEVGSNNSDLEEDCHEIENEELNS